MPEAPAVAGHAAVLRAAAGHVSRAAGRGLRAARHHEGGARRRATKRRRVSLSPTHRPRALTRRTLISPSPCCLSVCRASFPLSLTVGRSSLQVIMLGCAWANELDRAFATFEEYQSVFGLKHDVEACNALLFACQRAKNLQVRRLAPSSRLQLESASVEAINLMDPKWDAGRCGHVGAVGDGPPGRAPQRRDLPPCHQDPRAVPE